jgi:hypothetical protein
MVGEVLAGHYPTARLADSDGEVGEEQEEVESNRYAASGRVEVAGDGRPTASRGGGGGLVALSGGGRVREVQGGMVEQAGGLVWSEGLERELVVEL